MTTDADSAPSRSTAELVSEFVAEREIRAVIMRYCRGIDRRDYDLVRSCYHADATDEHGDFAGDVDDFIEHVQRAIVAYESTMHFIGNLLVEVDGDRARVESYVMAMHRLPVRGEPTAKDHVV
ncbi:MAG TPA: nuclear transport factor 2 family protein, partial [Ilumatobacteraceae bacterium]